MLFTELFQGIFVPGKIDAAAKAYPLKLFKQIAVSFADMVKIV